MTLYLRHVRIARGFSQVELGAIVGVTQSFLSSVETGRKLPGPRTRARLEKTLGDTWDRLNSPAEILNH